jgi:hypothetical protein
MDPMGEVKRETAKKAPQRALPNACWMGAETRTPLSPCDWPAEPGKANARRHQRKTLPAFRAGQRGEGPRRSQDGMDYDAVWRFHPDVIPAMRDINWPICPACRDRSSDIHSATMVARDSL